MKTTIFLTHMGKQYTVTRYLKSWGSAFSGTIRVRNYYGLRAPGQTWLKRLNEFGRSLNTGTLRRELHRAPAGVYVFTDIERLTAGEKKKAISLWERLESARPSPRMLNHPQRMLDRFDLLRALHEEGINNFNVYRVEEDLEPDRWPVFVRHRGRHGALLTDLLQGSEELKGALDQLLSKGHGRDDLMIVEYVSTADSSGITTKYGAFKIGDHVLRRQIHFGRSWFLRVPEIKTEESTLEELEYVRSRDHQELIERVFAVAGVDYGRLDYSVRGTQFYIWEINTNPMILIPADREDRLRFEAHDHFAGQLREALEDL